MGGRVPNVHNDRVERLSNFQAPDLVLQLAHARASKCGKPEQSGYLQWFRRERLRVRWISGRRERQDFGGDRRVLDHREDRGREPARDVSSKANL